MSPSIVHLPNGQTLTVTPVFGGIQFKSNSLNTGHSFFPPGWTVILHSEDDDDHHLPKPSIAAHTVAHPYTASSEADAAAQKKRHVHRFRQPTLANDHLFISAISNPASNDFRPASSPTRQIAMMLWATLWWYFHQIRPSPYLTTSASALTPEAGRPQGEWRVNINREGIFKGKHLLPKLERMGLIASEDSSVGLGSEDGMASIDEGWNQMFISQRSFWQLDARIYLFTLSPAQANSPYPGISPATSRPVSPSKNSGNLYPREGESAMNAAQAIAPHIGRANTPPGPFSSGSHLPTFYPPPPLQYTSTNGARHPIRPKPPRQGETFYTRYVPSLGQYLSFRVASLSPNPVVSRGLQPGMSDAAVPAIGSLSVQEQTQGETSTAHMSDIELLHKWMNDPRVAYSWGEQGPLEHQREFLKEALTSKHSFPVIGCFDGKPFGFFEIYWVKEDRLANLLGGTVADWDRGLHVLVGEQEFRGRHRVRVWLSALVHYCWLADLRTSTAMLEPRVDNEKLRRYCEEVGFFKEREVTFPHKQSNLMKIKREAWERPEL